MGRNPRPTRKFAVQLTTTAIDVAVGRPATNIHDDNYDDDDDGDDAGNDDVNNDCN